MDGDGFTYNSVDEARSIQESGQSLARGELPIHTHHGYIRDPRTDDDLNPSVAAELQERGFEGSGGNAKHGALFKLGQILGARPERKDSCESEYPHCADYVKSSSV